MAPTVTDVSDRRRFEIAVDGAVVGFAEYRRRPGVISFIHTEIDPAHKGEGLGTLLVKTALDTARAEGLAVLPYCPFVQGFIDRHREYLVGFAEYRRRPDVISFIHTEIDPAHKGEDWEHCSSKPRWIPHERRGWRCCPTAHSSRASSTVTTCLDLVPVERRAKFALDDG